VDPPGNRLPDCQLPEEDLLWDMVIWRLNEVTNPVKLRLPEECLNALNAAYS